MPPMDLRPATDRLAALVAAVPDDSMAAPTPCDFRVGDLLDHISALSLAFAAAARKEDGPLTEPPPAPDAARLGEGWRIRITTQLDRLADAWDEPSAWEGTARAGGVEMPGEVTAVVALDEVVLHGWDLAVATAQPFAVDPAELEAVHRFVLGFSGPGQEDARDGLFGPEVAVADDAPLLDRVLGLAGRDPAWRPPR